MVAIDEAEAVFGPLSDDERYRVRARHKACRWLLGASFGVTGDDPWDCCRLRNDGPEPQNGTEHPRRTPQALADAERWALVRRNAAALADPPSANGLQTRSSPPGANNPRVQKAPGLL